MRKQIVALLAGAMLMMAAGSASALTISIYEANNTTAINNWKSGFTGFTVAEDFEDYTASLSWYENLVTGIGTFNTFDGQYGTGTSSYYATHNKSEIPHFAVREATFGRSNTTSIPGAKMYLDSADITKLELQLISGVSNVFFYLTDPSDVGAKTKTSASSLASTSAEINYRQDNNTKWFVGIKSEGSGDIESIIWTTTNGTSPYRNDGFGLDDFTVAAAVPEPGTMMLLGLGMLGMAVYGKRRMNKQA